MTSTQLEVTCSHTNLVENITYDVAEIRLKATDENGNQLYFMNEPVSIEVEGPIAVIGPSCVPLQGGMSGIYVKSTGTSGEAKVKLRCTDMEPVEIKLQVICDETREE